MRSVFSLSTSRVSDIKRRVEARIGQLLGEAKPGPKQSLLVSKVSDGRDRSHFRLLARGFDGPQDPTGIKYRGRCSDGISPRARGVENTTGV